MTFNARIESAWAGKYFSCGSGRVAAYVGTTLQQRESTDEKKNKYSVSPVPVVTKK